MGAIRTWSLQACGSQWWLVACVQHPELHAGRGKLSCEEDTQEKEWSSMKPVGNAGMGSSSFPQENGKLSALPLLPIEICIKMHNSAPAVIKKADF